MDVGISTRCFGTEPLTLDRLERLRRAEFTQIELHAALPGLDYTNRSVVRDIVRWFGENELPSPSLHLPFEKNILASSRYERQAALDDFKRCLEINDLLPLQFVVMHLGNPRQEFNPVAFEHAYAAIATVQTFAGIRVLLETLDNDIATFARIKEFRNAAQLPDIGICYDTGHGEMEESCDAIHVDDGDRDWPALIERFVSLAFTGPVILEPSDDNLGAAADRRSRLRDLRDEAANSMEEFRLKYKLPFPRLEEDER
jgi:sugar phosphate isomerase/epimerase